MSYQSRSADTRCGTTADLGETRTSPSSARPLTIADAVDELLARVHSERCGPDVCRALLKTAEQLLRGQTPVAPRRMSQERSYLIHSGAFTFEQLARSETHIARGELRELEYRSALSAIAASHSESEVASRLGIVIDEVRQRRSSGELFAFDAAGIELYPTWQFTEAASGGLLPHLTGVLKALRPDERNPASVMAFMTVPKLDLAIDNEQLTPVQWLLRGGSPRVLEDILEAGWWR